MNARPRFSILTAITALLLVPSSAIVSEPATGREPCGEQSLPIVAPGARVLGSAIISNDLDFLYVDVHANSSENWRINKIQMYVGFDPVPMQGSEFDVSVFPYLYDDGITMMNRFRVPLVDLAEEDSYGRMLNIGIRLLAVGQSLKGDRILINAGTASAEHEVCAENSLKLGCTLTREYWRSHHSYSNKPAQNVDWPQPEDEDSLLCGRSWLSVLLTPPRGDTWKILAQEYISAKLNVAGGASAPLQVQTALNVSTGILNRNCDVIPDRDRVSATALSAILESFNSGLIGPGQCG